MELALDCGGDGEGGAGATYVSGSSGCVQLYPWFTHALQNPQAPSLQTSQRQKHSLAQARQRAQKLPLSSRRAGSSVVRVRLPSAPPGVCFGGL